MYTPLALLSMALAASNLVSAAALIPREVAADEVIVFGAGNRYEVVKLAEWEAELAKDNLTLGRPDSPLDHPELITEFNATESEGSDIEKRCRNDRVITRNRDQDFLDWDTPLSSVIQSRGDGDSIAAQSGYSVGSSISVSAGVDLAFVKDYISASVSTTFEQNWSSQVSTTYTLTIPKGQKWAVMVSNPRTYRRSGFVKTGCIGSQRSNYFQADQRFPQRHQGLSWVQGVIRICSSKTYPIKFCIGNGSHR